MMLSHSVASKEWISTFPPAVILSNYNYIYGISENKVFLPFTGPTCNIDLMYLMFNDSNIDEGYQTSVQLTVILLLYDEIWEIPKYVVKFPSTPGNSIANKNSISLNFAHIYIWTWVCQWCLWHRMYVMYM